MDPITIRAFHDELQHLQFEKNAIIDRDTIARGARLLATDVTDPALGAFSKATRALGFRAGVGGLPGPLRRPLLWPHELDALEHRVSSGIKNNIQEPLINGAKHLVGTSIGGRTLPPTLQHKVTNAVRGVVEQPTDVMMNAVGIFAPPEPHLVYPRTSRKLFSR